MCDDRAFVLNGENISSEEVRLKFLSDIPSMKASLETGCDTEAT